MSLGMTYAGIHLNGENFSCRKDLFQEKLKKPWTNQHIRFNCQERKKHCYEHKLLVDTSYPFQCQDQ